MAVGGPAGFDHASETSDRFYREVALLRGGIFLAGKRRLSTFLNEFELYIGAVLFIVMTVLLTLQVVSRYVLGASYSWTEELCTIFFIWMVYLGASSAVLKGKHLRIDLFLEKARGKRRKVLLIFTNLVTALFCGYMIFPLHKIIENFTRLKSKTILLRIPKDVIYGVLPLCLGLMVIRLFQDTLRIMNSKEQDVKIDMKKSIFDEPDGMKEQEKFAQNIIDAEGGSE